MPNNNQAQQENKNNDTNNIINLSGVIQKHHEHLIETFCALKSTFPEVNILNYNINKDNDNPEYIIEKLALLFQETGEIEKKLTEENWQSLQFFPDIVDNVKSHCLGVYRDLHLLFIKAKDIEEKKELIESAFLVGKILDYYSGLEILYKASIGLIPVTCQEINLKELVTKIITNVRPIAYYKRLVVDFKLAIDMPDLIISDQYRLKTILECLINDSIKANNNSNIFLTVNFFKNDRKNKQAENKDFVLQLILRNTHLIYSKEIQQALKDKLITFNHFIKNKYKLLGADLSLAKHFISDIDGKIEIEIDKKGTSFICYIPVLLAESNKDDIKGYNLCKR